MLGFFDVGCSLTQGGTTGVFGGEILYVFVNEPLGQYHDGEWTSEMVKHEEWWLLVTCEWENLQSKQKKYGDLRIKMRRFHQQRDDLQVISMASQSKMLPEQV